jgi:hypothetical protein
MSGWDVHQSTILQFDGKSSSNFVVDMTQAWSALRLSLGGCPES